MILPGRAAFTNHCRYRLPPRNPPGCILAGSREAKAAQRVPGLNNLVISQFSSRAFMATITVLADIQYAPRAGVSCTLPRITRRDLRVPTTHGSGASFRKPKPLRSAAARRVISWRGRGDGNGQAHGPAPTARLEVQCAETAVAVRLERALPSIRPGQSLLVVVCGKRAIRRLRRTVSSPWRYRHTPRCPVRGACGERQCALARTCASSRRPANICASPE